MREKAPVTGNSLECMCITHRLELSYVRHPTVHNYLPVLYTRPTILCVIIKILCAARGARFPAVLGQWPFRWNGTGSNLENGYRIFLFEDDGI